MMLEFTAQQIAEWTKGTIEGDQNVTVSKLAKIEEAEADALAFLANKKYESYLYKTNAGIVLVSKDLNIKATVNSTIIRVDDPYRSFTLLLQEVEKWMRPQARKGVHPTAIIDDSVEIPETAYVGPYVIIEQNAKIGDHVQLLGHNYIGENAKIGKNTKLYAQVTVYDACEIGNNCIIHSGTVIGSDGFGFAPNKDGSFIKVPQIGNVQIGDHVEIGANTSIDRATMGATKIGNHTKLDNLIQIAHNVEVGESTVIAAQTGVSGSTKIGKYCMIGGQVGIVGHINVANGTKINAQSGVSKSVKKENTALNGTPADDYRATLKSQVLFRRLPELLERIESLEKKKE